MRKFDSEGGQRSYLISTGGRRGKEAKDFSNFNSVNNSMIRQCNLATEVLKTETVGTVE